MSNSIKYTTGSETLALKKGNFYIGTGDVGKGPTSETGYYNGITPPSGGYTIYLNKVSGGPSIYTASNDAQLISLTNSIAGTSYTTANECLTYFAGQTDKLCVNRDYEGIITDGMILNVDAGFTPSYPKNGTTWYDISPSGNNGILTNGPTFSSNDGGSIVFDGTNDYVSVVLPSSISVSSFTHNVWFNADIVTGTYRTLIDLNNDNFLITIKPDGELSLWSPTFNLGFAPSVNTWYNIQVSHNHNNPYYTYINGNLVGTYSDSMTTTHTVCSIGVGAGFITGTCGSKGPDEFFDGKIPIASMYNRGLTSSEVLQNYNAQKGRFGL